MNQKRTQKPDPLELIKKYLMLLWQKKIWIITVTVLVSIIWVVVFKLFLQKPREFTTTAVIKFEDSRRRTVGAVAEFAQIGSEGNIAILHANSFLNKVADSLKLNLFLRKPILNRFETFLDIEIDENVKYGNYIIILDGQSIKVNYTNEREDINNLNLQLIPVPSNDTLHFDVNGLKFSIKKELLLAYKKLEFGVNPSRVVVDYLKNKLGTRLDRRTFTLLHITFASPNPSESAGLLNVIINMYVDKLLEVKRHRTTSVLNSLKEQLTAAQKDLEILENKLKNFRQRNPYLFLSNTGNELVSDLSGAESSLNNNNYKISRISNFLSSTQTSAEDQIVSNIYDGISILEDLTIPGTQNLVTQHNEAISEKNSLLASGYSTESSQIIDINMRIRTIEKQIINKLGEEKRSLENQNSNFQNVIKSSQRTISQLPQKELMLAELQRDRQVKSQIYSNILIRYNEAKVSDAATISDALIIDEAEVPIDYGGSNLIIYLIGPLLGIFLSAGFFVGFDILDNRVKEVDDIEVKLGLPVLTTIPVILDDSEVPDKLKTERELDQKLIAASYAPTIAGEKFRLLRTKFFMDSSKKQSIVITSLTPNDGKSLISSNLAITFAQQKIPTVLLDCDLRRGVLHNSFKCNKKPGVTDLLMKNSPITVEEITNSLQTTHIPNLFLISTGMQVPNPSELLGGLRMKQVIETLEKKFSVVIIDSPPIEFIPDALVLNSFIHNFVLVVRYGKTNINKIRKKMEEYSAIENDLRGVVINCAKEYSQKDYHSYSYYHY